MTLTTVPERGFARDLASAKKAAIAEPVIVTNRRRPTDALLKVKDCFKLAGTQRHGLLAFMDDIPDGHFRFEPPRLTGHDLKPADLNARGRFLLDTNVISQFRSDKPHPPAPAAMMHPPYRCLGGDSFYLICSHMAPMGPDAQPASR